MPAWPGCDWLVTLLAQAFHFTDAPGAVGLELSGDGADQRFDNDEKRC